MKYINITPAPLEGETPFDKMYGVIVMVVALLVLCVIVGVVAYCVSATASPIAPLVYANCHTPQPEPFKRHQHDCTK